MTIVCNIWMICLELNWFVYDPRLMLHFSEDSEFVWTLRSSVLVVFNNFLLIDATERSRNSSDQKRFFIALCLYPLSFFANTPFNFIKVWIITYFLPHFPTWNFQEDVHDVKTLKNSLNEKMCWYVFFYIFFILQYLQTVVIKKLVNDYRFRYFCY